MPAYQLLAIGGYDKTEVTDQVLVTSKEDGVQHGLVQKEVPHPLFMSAYSSSLGRT